MISVCMASYNGEKFIHQQIISILEQLSNSDELIISDDSSTDKTVQIIRSFKDKRINLFANQLFRDPLRNFEFALNKASGDIIFLSDQDDLWRDGKVMHMCSALAKADLVVCDHSIVNDKGEILLESYFKKFPKRAKPGIIRNLRVNSYTGCCMAFRKKILKKALPFPKDVQWHDWWLGMVAEMHFKTTFLSIPLTLYRSHGNNVTHVAINDFASQNSLKIKLKYRWNILKYFPLLLFK